MSRRLVRADCSRHLAAGVRRPQTMYAQMCVGDISPKVGGSDNFGRPRIQARGTESTAFGQLSRASITHASYLHQGSRPASAAATAGATATASSQALAAPAGMRLRSPALYGMGHFVQTAAFRPTFMAGGWQRRPMSISA